MNRGECERDAPYPPGARADAGGQRLVGRDGGVSGLHVGLITTWHTVCGIAEYSRALADALRRRGHRVTVLANHPVHPVPGAVDDGDVVRFFRTGWHDQRDAGQDLALRAVRERGVEVLHLQYQNFLYPPEFLPALRALAGAAPLVATFHDAGVPGEFPRELVRRPIVHSPATGRMLAWPEAEVIPIGVHDWPTPSAALVRAGLGIASRHVLCSLGLGRNDYPPVLQAVRDLKGRYPDILWLVLGPEGYVEAVRQAARELGVEEHVRVAGGFRPLEELFAHMHAADIVLFYFPENGIEGVSSSSCRLGIASRRPVILTDVGWTRDLPGELKIPPGPVEALKERIVRIFEDGALRQSLLDVQERVIATTSWAKTAERHEQVYRAALCR